MKLFAALIIVVSSVWAPAATSSSVKTTELVVAADGSGQYKTVQEAIAAAPTGSVTNPIVIRIKPGVYKELIYVQREKRYVRLIGEDASKTVVTYGLHANMIGMDGKPMGTYRTPTAVIDADDFTVENVTFENSAGPVGQALAIRIDGDRVVFRGCRFLGWQDTVFTNRGRHFFQDCYIQGHVDFIFGGSTAFFDRCHVHCLKNGYITAASTPQEHPYGFVFSHCRITGEPDVKTYLGRPWRDYSSVIFLTTEMSEVIRPEGWNNWNLPEREKTARYSEWDNSGPGSRLTGRVDWMRTLKPDDAKRLTPERVLGDVDRWNPSAR
jgi:pectinesterase